MLDNKIVAYLIQLASGDTGDDMRRDHIENFSGQFAGTAHRLKVVFRMNGY